VPVEVRAIPAERLPPDVEVTAYYVISEALQNVAKYSQAGAAFVRVDPAPGGLRIEVTDDGIGGATVTSGGGLCGLTDRVEAVKGHLTLNSPHREGTQVIAELSCES
jgi:signal transduction histidine kinase